MGVTDSNGINTESITEEEFLALPDNYYDSASFVNDSVVTNNQQENSAGDTRSFNLRDNISMNIRATQARPSDRPNSGFLSLAGTSDRNKGLEITDETGIKHGAFTKALLMVYKKNPCSYKDFSQRYNALIILILLRYRRITQIRFYNV